MENIFFTKNQNSQELKVQLNLTSFAGMSLMLYDKPIELYEFREVYELLGSKFLKL